MSPLDRKGPSLDPFEAVAVATVFFLVLVLVALRVYDLYIAPGGAL